MRFMKTCLLDGLAAGDSLRVPILAAIRASLGEESQFVEIHELHVKEIPDCHGDYNCWLRTPGACNMEGPHLDISRSFVNSDLAVFLTPVTFGGYSYQLKKVLDHFVPNILPTFELHEKEWHHEMRYEKLPRLCVIGVLDAPDEEAEPVFRGLVYRNSLNLRPEKYAVGVVYRNAQQESISCIVATLVKESIG